MYYRIVHVLWCLVCLILFVFFSILIFERMMFMGMEGHHSPLRGKKWLLSEGVSWAFPWVQSLFLEGRGTSMNYGIHVAIQCFTLGGDKGRFLWLMVHAFEALWRNFFPLYLASPHGLGTPSPILLDCYGNLLSKLKMGV